MGVLSRLDSENDTVVEVTTAPPVLNAIFWVAKVASLGSESVFFFGAVITSTTIVVRVKLIIYSFFGTSNQKVKYQKNDQNTIKVLQKQTFTYRLLLFYT